ncbi:MAG: hypothetical protein LBC62_00875, partial [Treponema sp.]|nr:hypothetical protein [Treponema sp.]
MSNYKGTKNLTATVKKSKKEGENKELSKDSSLFRLLRCQCRFFSIPLYAASPGIYDVPMELYPLRYILDGYVYLDPRDDCTAAAR